jgi:peptidoglycan-associated lipoprotein
MNRVTRPRPSLAPGLVATVLVVLVTACTARSSPVTPPAPPAPGPEPSASPAVPPPPAPPPPAPRPPAPLVPPDPIPLDTFESRSLDDLNRESPLQIVFFDYDSAELQEAARAALRTNADLLNSSISWVITIEGHCDERGTAEYNLGLGERRAFAARNYLLELGIAAQRVRTVSYGKEFPFDPAHDERAWAQNRRAHFVITAQ